jgi:hypothetical protein
MVRLSTVYTEVWRAMGAGSAIVVEFTGRDGNVIATERYGNTWGALDNVLTRGHAGGHITALDENGERLKRVCFKKTATRLLMEGDIECAVEVPEPCSFERLAHEAHVACLGGSGQIEAYAEVVAGHGVFPLRATADTTLFALDSVVKQAAPYMSYGAALWVALYVDDAPRFRIRFSYVRPGVALAMTYAHRVEHEYAVDGMSW